MVAAVARSRKIRRAEAPAVDPSVGAGAPDLRIAAAYDLPSFERLLHTGIASDGKTRELMSPTARARFASLTPDEVKALHDYLVKRVEAQL